MTKDKLEKLKKLRELIKSNKFTPEKLKEILSMLNDGLSKEEFIKAFKVIEKHILKTEIKLIERLDNKTAKEKKRLEELATEFKQILNKAQKESDSTFSGIRLKTFEMINKLFARNDVNKKLKEILNEADKKISEIDSKLSEVTDGYTPFKYIFPSVPILTRSVFGPPKLTPKSTILKLLVVSPPSPAPKYQVLFVESNVDFKLTAAPESAPSASKYICE